MIVVRVYEQDAARHRHLRRAVSCVDWVAALAFLARSVVEGGTRSYEIEERADTPGDAGGD